MLGEVAGRQVRAGAAVSLGGVTEALRQQRAIVLYVFEWDGAADERSWNSKLCESSRDA